MVSTLQDLPGYIRATLPYPQAILQLRVNSSAGGVTFIWHGVEFFVKPSFQVLELRGNSLFLTGLSTLLQSVLMSSDQRGRRMEAALEIVTHAEDQVRVQSQPRAAAQTLAEARKLLEKVLGRSQSAFSPG
jgi:hypothetical protein